MPTNCDKIDMIEEEDKYKDIEESFKNVYKDDNDDNFTLHVKGV